MVADAVQAVEVMLYILWEYQVNEGVTCRGYFVHLLRV
jgi:hypothetical protein